MDYKLPEKLTWWQYVLIVLLSLVFILINSKIILFNTTLMDFGFWGFITNAMAILVALGIYIVTLIREEKMNSELEKYLLNELFNDLLFINTNLRKIREFRDSHNPLKEVYGFCYISNDIFYALINSNRIIITKGKFALLMSFYNCDQTIRRIMDNSDQISINILMPSQAFATMLSISDGKGSLVENTFIEMKELLGKIFMAWEKEEYFKKWQDKGLEEWQEYQKSQGIIEHSTKNQSPQIF